MIYRRLVLILCFNLKVRGVVGGSCQTGFTSRLGQRSGDEIKGVYGDGGGGADLAVDLIGGGWDGSA